MLHTNTSEKNGMADTKGNPRYELRKKMMIPELRINPLGQKKQILIFFDSIAFATVKT